MADGIRRRIRPHHRKPDTRRQPVQSCDPVFAIVHNRPASPGSDAGSLRLVHQIPRRPRRRPATTGRTGAGTGSAPAPACHTEAVS